MKKMKEEEEEEKTTASKKIAKDMDPAHLLIHCGFWDGFHNNCFYCGNLNPPRCRGDREVKEA